MVYIKNKENKMPLKITNEKYLENLRNKKIKVIPIEKYINAKTKIKHKCTCGNIWEVMPNKVYRGDTCGCNHNISNKKYMGMLNKKSIKVIPLEDYKGVKIKIKHKCICGNIWEVTPDSVLQGSSCGCANKKVLRKGHSIKTYKNRKTLLYYITIDDIPKIGICLLERYKEPEDAIFKYRYSSEKKNHNIKIIDYKIYNDGAEACSIEWAIKHRLKDFRYSGPKFIREDKGGGESECFDRDIYHLVEKYFI